MNIDDHNLGSECAGDHLKSEASARELTHQLWLLKTHLMQKGVKGVEVEDGRGFEISDPFDPSKNIIVRDAVAFGYRPTIEGTRPALEYAETWAKDNVSELDWLTEIDKLILSARQEDCAIPPDALASPNPILVQEATSRDEALGATLRLNQRLALVVIGKNCFIHDGVTDGMMSAAAVRALLASDKCTVEKIVPVICRDGTPKVSATGEPVTRIKVEMAESFAAWNESPVRRTYYGVEFAPNNITATGEPRNPLKLNKWVGFEYANTPHIIVPNSGSAAIILDHMEKVFHNGNGETLKYELQWLAHMLRFPQEKPHAHIARYEPTGGTGKDIFGNMLRFKIVGAAHSTAASGNDQLCNNFNANHENAILLIGNEIAWGKNHSHRHKLYDETASVVRQIEPKGVDRYDVFNYTRYILHSNDPNPINVKKGDRRFLALRCYDIAEDFNEGKMDPRYQAYFKALGDACSDPATIHGFVEYLLHIDLSDFNRFRAPDTAAKRELVELNLEDHEKWLLHLARSGQIETRYGTVELSEASSTLVHRRYVQESAQEFFSQREKALETIVGKALSTDGLVRKVERRPGGGEKVRSYEFPRLAEFRSKVAKIIGLTVQECSGQWEEIDDKEYADRMGAGVFSDVI